MREAGNAVADVLDRAADRIERDGWWQGAYCPSLDVVVHVEAARLDPGLHLAMHPQPCCVSGAILAESVVTGSRRAWLTGLAAIDALESTLPVTPVHVWNDKPWQTQDKVLAALREAARRERGRGL